MDGPWKVYFRIAERSIEETVEFLRSNIKNKSVWYFHPNGVEAGPHIHGLLWDYDQTAETLRNKIKKFFNLTNKTHYGLSNKYERGTVMSEDTVRGYITYMSKGKYDPILSNIYDTGLFEECKREWKEPRTIRINGDLQVITNGTVTETRGPTQWDIAREAQARFLELYANIEYSTNPGYCNHRIAKFVLEVLKENKKKRDKRTVANLCQDIIADLSPADYIGQILSMV